jgi:hypothetical protein
MGVDQIFLGHEPFRINEKAVENLPERNQIEILRFPLTHTARDTVTMSQMMWDQGCRVFIVLGGDGTSRIVARSFPDAIILPLSTGTNNVFPYRLEASVAGMAAGIIATGKIDTDACKRCKRITITKGDIEDIALIDAVLLKNDFLGSLLPFKADDITSIALTRAEPASIGVSPIGGFIEPAGHHDDFGVWVSCSPNAPQKINVPLSPGLHEDVGIETARKISIEETVYFEGPGILAFDGDRTLKLEQGEKASAVLRRDGPLIIEAEQVMRSAAERKILLVTGKT